MTYEPCKGTVPLASCLGVMFGLSSPNVSNAAENIPPNVSNVAEDLPSDAIERTPLGLTVDVGVASAYGYRGRNLAAAASQHEQRLVLQPSLTYVLPETGLELEYFSSYQATGDRRAMVESGSSDEQDLVATMEREVTTGLSLGASLSAFVYPMATKQAAGADAPVYLEPGVSAAWSTSLDLRLSTSFLCGLQDGIRSTRYVYVNPTLGKTFELTNGVSLTGSMGYGLKAGGPADNMHDVLLDVSASFEPWAFFYLSPSVHWAWTNLGGAPFVDEQFTWFSTNVGSSF